MRILVTNDDGIHAKGLKILCEKAAKFGQVIVVAPKTEQSATSQSIRLRTGLVGERVEDLIAGVETYTVDSTPADCVRYARYFLKDDFDLVFSGINNGYNLGEDILYSGTVGAATEAVLAGAKAIAFSSKHNQFEVASKYFDEVVEFIFKNELLNKCSLWNVNFPTEYQGIRFTKQGNTYFDTKLILEEGLVWQKGKPCFEKDAINPNSDVASILEGFVSVTPLTVNRTAISVLDSIIKG